MGHIAVTLARSGSKEVRDKNILNINNTAVSHFPMLAAANSLGISHLIYSSDSTRYLELAQKFYDQQNFKNLTLELHLRSSRNSSDQAGSWDAIREIVEDQSLASRTKQVVLLAATCPTINSADIDLFFENIDVTKSAMSVREIDYPIENTFMNSNGSFKKHALTSFLGARQEKSKIFRPDGHIYFRPLSDLNIKFPNEETQLVNLNKEFYSNIDTKLDYELAKFTLESRL